MKNIPDSSMLKGSFLVLAPLLSGQSFASNASIVVDNQSYKIESWSWEIVRNTSQGGGGGAGATSFGNLVVETADDRLSARLLELIATQAAIQVVTLADNNVQIDVENVNLGALSLVKPGNHRVEFAFQRYAYTVNSMTVCFDISQNVTC